MTRLVVDASVAVKWVLPEVHAEAAGRLIEGPTDLLAPDLLHVEVANAFWKRALRDELSSDEARAAASAIADLPLRVLPARRFLPAAVEIACRLRRPIYDSLYLAIAVDHGIPLVTADRRFHDHVAASPLGDAIVWIEAA